MILKPYQLSNISGKNSKFFLFYGQNEGHKNEAIHQILNMGFTKNIFRYEEDEIFKNYNNFISEISNKSFFEEKKIIIISRVSEKIYSLIDDVMNKNIEDAKIILNSKPLDKKSKLRSNFEKEKNLVCVAFYDDNNTTLTNLANKFFYENKVPISREVLNHLIERCRGDRINLKNEISKIEAFLKGKGKISVDEILKLTNLAENYSFSELADACLSKNKKKTLLIINENNFSSEDCVAIIRIFLAKAKRIFALKTMGK
jgi:DNA polymerase III, delta subunit